MQSHRPFLGHLYGSEVSLCWVSRSLVPPPLSPKAALCQQCEKENGVLPGYHEHAGTSRCVSQHQADPSFGEQSVCFTAVSEDS